jgi:predicted P-loop ATPase
MTTSPSDDAQASPAEQHVVSITAARKPRLQPLTSDRPNWLADAVDDDRGRVLPILRNVALALRSAPQLAEAFSFDELQRFVIVDTDLPLAEGAGERNVAPPPRPLTDADVSQVQEWLQSMGLPKIGREIVHQAISLRAQERAFHPVRDYLGGLKWDCKPRLGAWIPTYLGAEMTPYTRAIGRMFLLAAIARIYEPGCKADYVLVLEGQQGAGKSQACKKLGEPWFSDSLPDVSREQAASQHLRGRWFIEISELSALTRAEAEALKSFISRPVERYRAPYDRGEVIEPRQCVFIGTTNRETYLGDDTGGRRFWPAKVGRIDLDALTADRDQLFAEAVVAYRAGERWWPDAAFEREHIRAEQEERFEVDAWEETIAAFLVGRNRVQVSEVARDAIGIITAKIGTAEQRSIGRVLNRLGWESGRSNGIRYFISP